MDVWTKHFHDMATGKLETVHKSVHNAPQPTESQHTDQFGGSQVPPKTENVISTIDRIKRLKKRVGSVIKKKVQKSAKTNPKNKKATGKTRSVGANKSQQKAVKKARQNEFGVRRRLQQQAGNFF